MKKSINPTELFDSRQHGFSQITISEPGRQVFISGQVAWDENAEIVGPGDLELQTRKTMDNLKIAIESAGGTLHPIRPYKKWGLSSLRPTSHLPDGSIFPRS